MNTGTSKYQCDRASVLFLIYRLLEYCRSNGGIYRLSRSLRDDDLLHRLQDLHLDSDHVYTAAEDLASAETGGVSLRTEPTGRSRMERSRITTYLNGVLTIIIVSLIEIVIFVKFFA